MRAVAIRNAGPPETLEAIDAPEPTAGPGQILIRVHRAGVNFADILARQGIYPDAPKPPFIPGYEVSGVVAAVGAGAGEFRGGERVAAFTRFGGYAELAVADARFAVSLPASSRSSCSNRAAASSASISSGSSTIAPRSGCSSCGARSSAPPRGRQDP